MGAHVVLPVLTAFFVVLILGVIAIIIAATKEKSLGTSLFWFWTAIWATCLALLL